MTQIVTGPDGVEHEFPDETPDDVIKNVMKKTYGEDTSGFVGGAKSFIRGAGRGVASLPDAPAAAYTGIKNLPTRVFNTFGGERPVVSDEHGDAPVPVDLLTPQRQREAGAPTQPVAPLQPPSPDNQVPLAVAPQTPISSAYNASFPVDPNHPWADVTGTVAGPAIVEAIASGGGSLLTLPGALAATRRAVATTGGTLAGGKGGELIDKSLGGSGDIGSVIGSVVGGGVAPGLTTQAGWKGFSTGLTDADSAVRLAAVDRLNKLLPPDQQIPVSAGLVGNKMAGQLEALTTTPPGGGGPVYRTREAQQLGLDAAAQQIAENMRGEPSAVEGINPSTVGQGVRDTAAAADEAAKAAADAAINPMAERVGRDLPISQTTQLDQMETLRKGSQPQYREPVAREIANVNVSRFDPENPPKVVDPALEAQLQMQLNQATRQKAAARNSTQADAAQAQIDAVQAEIDKNRGQTFQQAIESRSKLGRRVEGQQPLDAAQTLQVKAAQTEAMKEAARLAGVPPEEFDAAFGEYGRIQDQRAIFDKLMNNAGQGEAYNQLFSGTSTQNLDRFRALREHAPERLRQILADQYEIKMRGAGAGLPPNASTLTTTKTGPDWWAKLPQETRHFTAETLPNYDDAKALEIAMREDARRPARTLPSQGGAVTGSNIFKQAAAPLTGGGAGFVLGGIPGALAGLFGPSAVANLTGRALTNPNIVRRLVTPGSWTQGQSLSRILAAATGNLGPTVYRPSPLDEQGAH
jgi:hypothetical protein